MVTVTLWTIDNKRLIINLERQDKIIKKTGSLGYGVFDIVRIFRPGELKYNSNTIVFGQNDNSGVFLPLDDNNAAILDAAFEQLGCVGNEKELWYRIG